jgi:DNA modification methylase
VSEIDEVLAGTRRWTVVQGDCLDVMRGMPDGVVQCCVTSPPYWGLRKYDVQETVWGGRRDCAHEYGDAEPPHHPGQVEQTKWKAAKAAGSGQTASSGSFCRLCGAWRGQLGLEPTPTLYVEHLVGIFREVRRVLRDDGTLWLNIGDSYAATHTGAPGRGSRHDSFHFDESRLVAQGKGVRREKEIPDGLKPKDLIGIPWLLAFALRADGWYLRAEIIWHKTAPMPESVRDRPTRAHEQLFLCSKSVRYCYEHQAASDPATHAGKNVTLQDKSLSNGSANGAGIAPSGNGAASSITVSSRRNWRTVWTIGPEPNKAQHYAPFPRELARRCIVAGSAAGDVVMDPFAGTGTTGAVAHGIGRAFLGVELGDGYAEIARSRIRAAEIATGTVAAQDTRSGEQVGLLTEVRS